VGRFLYTDAINTLIGGFLAIFAQTELGLDSTGSRNLLATAIAFSILGGVIGARLVDRTGPLRYLRAVLLLWIGALLAGVVAAYTGWQPLVWLVGVAGGIALGGTWTSDRVAMVHLSPPERLGEYYGLYATVGRFATVLGPLTWTAVADLLGLGRKAALGALTLFVAAAWVVLRGVSDPEPPRRPQKR
jgi:UMF1 family MFS transporter